MAGDPLTTAVGAKVDVNGDGDGHDNDGIDGATMMIILLLMSSKQNAVPDQCSYR